MKNYFSIIFCVILTVSLYGQDGGMRVYAGTTSLVNKDKIANPDGFSHSGYHIGADGRLMAGGMSFLVGVRYTSVSGSATKDFKLLGHESTLSLMNGRVGLGISLFTFSNLIRVRTKILGSFDIILAKGGPNLSPPGFLLNDGWAGLVTGLGVDVGPIVVDLEYEFGVINGYNQKKSSTFNSLSLSLGFFF